MSKKRRVISTPTMAIYNGFASALSVTTDDYYLCNNKIMDKEGFISFIEEKDIHSLLKSDDKAKKLNLVSSAMFSVMAFYKDKVETNVDIDMGIVSISKYGQTFDFIEYDDIDFTTVKSLCHYIIFESGRLLNLMKVNNISDVFSSKKQIQLAM